MGFVINFEHQFCVRVFVKHADNFVSFSHSLINSQFGPFSNCLHHMEIISLIFSQASHAYQFWHQVLSLLFFTIPNNDFDQGLVEIADGRLVSISVVVDKAELLLGLVSDECGLGGHGVIDFDDFVDAVIAVSSDY